ncbi:MAG: 3-deoxy-D-manno-octulosonic acid transferase, partial [Armatimonadetes bacterium]|nr:3-deoxy-D-manno-octulosonic acid transferase [Armatimonadota bacterium]
MIPLLYNLLFLLALPGIVLFYLVRQLRRGRVREGWPERLGRLPDELVDRCRGRRG